MAAATFGTVFQQLRRAADRHRAATLPDALLLERFTRQRDEAAFAALLDRHGPTVFGVCQRILRDAHAAEDAFQATFLVFVRKAGSIGKADSLGCWFYEVAYRTALRAKVNTARQRLRERQAPLMSDTLPATDLDWKELRPILDDELHRLPENFRRPFVLCYLEGKTHADAAVLLGWPKGTVAGRLSRARELLRERLVRHGVTLSAAGLASLLPGQATAAVPRTLLDATLRAGLLFAAGQPTTAFASTTSVALAKEVLQVMFPKKLHFALALLLAVGVCAGIAQFTRSASNPPAPEKHPAAAAAGDAARLPAGAVARMGGTELRHGDRIHFVTFTHDGKRLVSAAADYTVRVWDATSGRELRRFSLPKPEFGKGADPRMPVGMFLAALSGDDKYLAAAREDLVFVWDLAIGKELHRLRAPRPDGTSLAFGDGGRALLLVDAANGVTDWDVRTGDARRGIEPEPLKGLGSRSRRTIPGAVLSADGTVLAHPYSDPKTGKLSVRVTDRRSGTKLAEFEVARVAGAFAFSPSEKTLAWGTQQGQIFLWDVAARKMRAEFPMGAARRPVVSLALSHAVDKLALSREDGIVELWDVTGGKLLAKLTGPSVPAGPTAFLFQRGVSRSDLAFSFDGKRLAVGAFGSRVRLFDTATGQEIGPAGTGHADAVRAMGLSPDGKTLVTHGRGDAVRFWDLSSGKVLGHVRIPVETASAALTPDGSLLATVGGGKAMLFDLATGKEKGKLTQPEVPGGALCFSADGKTLAARQSQGQVRLWDVTTGKFLPPAQDEAPTVREGVAGFNNSLRMLLTEPALTPDGKYWVSSDAENRLALYEAESGSLLGEFKLDRRQLILRVAFSPDGRTLATANYDGTLTLYETATCRRRGSLGTASKSGPPPAPPLVLGDGRAVTLQGGSETPFAVAFSHDGRVLASNPSGAKIALWDLRTGKELTKFDGHQGGIVSLAFSAEDRRLISGSLDSTVLVWDTSRYAARSGPATGKLEAGTAEKLWADLLGEDAERAFSAVQALWAAPADAVALLKQQLRPVPAIEPGRIDKLLANLDAKSFAAREQAAAELEMLGDLVKPAARQAIAKGSTLEVRQRLEKLLAKLRVRPASAETLATLRGMEVLEYVGTQEARLVLRSLAGGAPGVRQTEEARLALQRLNRNQ
jgi:RNA polymerase sigma factor (sigma-70 family)